MGLPFWFAIDWHRGILNDTILHTPWFEWFFPSSEKTKIKQERHLELVFKMSSKKRFAVLSDSRCTCRDPHQPLFWRECCNLSLVRRLLKWCTLLTQILKYWWGCLPTISIYENWNLAEDPHHAGPVQFLASNQYKNNGHSCMTLCKQDWAGPTPGCNLSRWPCLMK